MINYTTETGFYVLMDSNGRIAGKANVSVGDHPVPDWVDKSESFDVGSADELSNYDIDPDYIDG